MCTCLAGCPKCAKKVVCKVYSLDTYRFKLQVEGLTKQQAIADSLMTRQESIELHLKNIEIIKTRIIVNREVNTGDGA